MPYAVPTTSVQLEYTTMEWENWINNRWRTRNWQRIYAILINSAVFFKPWRIKSGVIMLTAKSLCMCLSVASWHVNSKRICMRLFFYSKEGFITISAISRSYIIFGSSVAVSVYVYWNADFWRGFIFFLSNIYTDRVRKLKNNHHSMWNELTKTIRFYVRKISRSISKKAAIVPLHCMLLI